MTVNLNDWLGAHLAVLWLGLALLMAALELLALDLSFAMLAGGGVIAALIALLAGPWWVSLLAGAGAAMLLLRILRPALRRRLGGGALGSGDGSATP